MPSKMKKEYIEGGRAEGIDKITLIKILVERGLSWDEAKDQIDAGIKVEMEHTINPAIAEEICRDHLMEFPDYYNALAEMEINLRKKWSC